MNFRKLLITILLLSMAQQLLAFSFAASRAYSGHRSMFTIGDIDGVNGNDLVSAYGRSYSVSFNNGDGTFSNAASTSFQAGEFSFDNYYDDIVSLSLDDVDGSNGLDLVLLVENGVNPGNNRILVSLNNGDGTFSDPDYYYTGGDRSEFLTTADIDGVNGLDVLVVNR